eukprot:7325521-Pyramimonas_sp.AAC.1
MVGFRPLEIVEGREGDAIDGGSRAAAGNFFHVAVNALDMKYGQPHTLTNSTNFREHFINELGHDRIEERIIRARRA